MFRKKSPNKLCVLTFSVCTVLLFVSSLQAQPLHSVMLSMPEYSEEALTWCGPATAQMIMKGYPSGSCFVLQEDIWIAIQSYKAEAMWDTDPRGLKGAMNHLCPPAGTWVVYSKTDPGKLMHSVAYWMTTNNYPAAGLLNTLPHNSYAAHAERWIAIRGIVTDADPTTNSSVTLQFVWFNDPAPENLADPCIVRYISGSTWYSEFQPVTKAGSSYHGKYVAIIEPPEFEGIAIAPVQVLTGKVIAAEEALEYATKWIDEYKLYEIRPYKILEKAKPLTPLLVNRNYGGYYIVPYALEEGRLVQAAVLVNAYTGEFQEVGRFKPSRYMPKEEAIRVALEHLKVKEPKEIKAALVFPTKERVVSRYFPLWEVKVDRKLLAVNRQGKIYTKIPRAGCIHFEDQSLGTRYKVGDTFTDSGVKIYVRPFEWSSGQLTYDGFAKVVKGGLAGGSGQEMAVNNVNFSFDFGGPCRGLFLLFGEYGGNLNIDINLDFRNFQNFADINGATIGGVNVSIINGFGNDQGTLTLSGPIESFTIGGQELWVDEVCYR